MVTCNKLFLLLAKLNRCIDGKNFLKSPQFFFFLSFFLFFLSGRVFRAYIFSFPLIHQVSSSLLPLSMTRYPLELLFKSRKQCSSLISIVFSHPFSSTPRFFHSPLPRCFSLSPIHPASLSRNPLSHSLLLLLLLPSCQSNLIKVYPCSVSALSVSHQPRLFFYLRSSLRRSLLASPGQLLLWTNGNLNNPVHKPSLNAGQ